MPWELILSSAGGASVAIVLAVMFAQRIVEKTVDAKFERKLEELKAEIGQQLETERSELAVWQKLRNDILSQVWGAHREVVKAMTELIFDVQAFQYSSGKFNQKSVEQYRRVVHSNLDLLTPEAVEACQSFLIEAFAIAEGTRPPEDASGLKAARRKLYESATTYFGLEKMMPWMSSTKSHKNSATRN